MSPLEPPAAGRYGSRYGSLPSGPGERSCPVCQTLLAPGRARYCSAACKQQAYRLRHQAGTIVDGSALRRELQQRRALVAQTIYECPACEARYVGERRCSDCNRFCRAVGLGGLCPHCDEPLTLAELLGVDVGDRGRG